MLMELESSVRLRLLKDELFRSPTVSRRSEIRREVAILEESLEAERRAIEERQGELF
nr:hypothetical protein [uncultured Dethiosulfovibrio sp.]